jgi:hypothetical protein
MDELRAAEALLTTAEQVGVWGGSLSLHCGASYLPCADRGGGFKPRSSWCGCMGRLSRCTAVTPICPVLIREAGVRTTLQLVAHGRGLYDPTHDEGEGGGGCGGWLAGLDSHAELPRMAGSAAVDCRLQLLVAAADAAGGPVRTPHIHAARDGSCDLDDSGVSTGRRHQRMALEEGLTPTPSLRACCPR